MARPDLRRLLPFLEMFILLELCAYTLLSRAAKLDKGVNFFVIGEDIWHIVDGLSGISHNRPARSINVNSLHDVIEAMKRVERFTPCRRQYLKLLDLPSNESVLTSVVDFPSLRGNSLSAVYTANLLSNALGFNRSHGLESVFHNRELYYSLVRTNLNANPSLFGSCIAFDNHWFGDSGRFGPCAHGTRNGDNLEILEQDMSEDIDYTSHNTPVTGWFTGYMTSRLRGGTKSDYLQRRLNATYYQDKINIQHAFVTEEDGTWTDPYFDCGVTNKWVVTFSVPFYDADLSFQGVVTVDMALLSLDVNQCEGGTGIFAGSHMCSEASTYCNFTPGKGFVSGAYTCRCRDGYYMSNKSDEQTQAEGFAGAEVERFHRATQGDGISDDHEYTCLKCADGCTTCVDSTPCLLEGDMLLRTVVLGIQSFCMVLSFLLIGMVLRHRTLKVIACDSPWMLVVILVGAFLLYAVIIAAFVTPTVTSCFARRWLRGWGFAIAYGMLVLKIYRKLAIFQTRSATRVLVRDRDVLKWLVLILTVLSGFLVVWTVFSIQTMYKCGESIVEISTIDETVDNMKFYVCALKWWDYVIDIIEFLFLLFAIYLCYSVRAAPSEFHETRFITVAVYNEIIMTSIFHVLRHLLWRTTHPDLMFLITFIHSQLTTSVMLGLIFIPKLVIIHKIMNDAEFRERVNSKVNYDSSDSGSNTKSWKNAAFTSKNIGSMVNTSDNQNLSPDEIREELRRLYTQLEIYKTKSLKIDNPHLPSKKRGVSKWRTPRRFSRGHSMRTHSGHSESERSSEIARSNESLTKAVEMNDYRPNHRKPADGFDHVITSSPVTEGVVTPSQKWSSK